MKILFWDLETSLSIVSTFSLYPNAIQHTNIIQDPFIMTASWKWIGQKTVHGIKLTSKEAKIGDDRRLVKKIHKVIEEADVIVGHNGDKFDLRWLKGRALKHGLPPLSFVKTIDTLKVARKNFKLLSNRLDYLGKFLLDEGKYHTTSGLWIRSLKGDSKALKEMLEYNKQDVVLLERVYEKLRPWTENHPNMSLIENKHDISCKACNSPNIIKNGTTYTQARRYQKYMCKSCGHIFKDNKSIK